MATKNGCPECCCVLGICCDAVAAREAFSDKLVADLGISSDEASRIIDWVQKDFMLAPKSFGPAIAAVAQMAHRATKAGTFKRADDA